MSDSDTRQVVITEGDFHRAAAITESRFDNASLEDERVVLAREFVGAAFALERAVRSHARCALVNHCGTHGSNNLDDATDVLYQALSEYATLIGEIAFRFHDVTKLSVSDVARPADDQSASNGRFAAH